MTPRVVDFGKCGCGRSETGYCNGSHALTVAEYTLKLMSRPAEYQLMPEVDQDRDQKSVPYAAT